MLSYRQGLCAQGQLWHKASWADLGTGAARSPGSRMRSQAAAAAARPASLSMLHSAFSRSPDLLSFMSSLLSLSFSFLLSLSLHLPSAFLLFSFSAFLSFFPPFLLPSLSPSLPSSLPLFLPSFFLPCFAFLRFPLIFPWKSRGCHYPLIRIIFSYGDR